MQNYRSSRVNSREKKFLAFFFIFFFIFLRVLKVGAHTHTHATADQIVDKGAHTFFFLFTLQTYDIQIHGQIEKFRGACAGAQGKEAKAAISEIGKRADYSDGPGAASEDVHGFCRVSCFLSTPPPLLFYLCCLLAAV